MDVWVTIQRHGRMRCRNKEQSKKRGDRNEEFHANSRRCDRDQNAGVRLASAYYSRLVVMSLTGLPFSSTKRTQKSLRPGPLMTAPRRTFFPLWSVSGLETTSSITMRRSLKRSTTSLPFSHHMEALFEPTATRTSFLSRGLLTMVTAQKMTP